MKMFLEPDRWYAWDDVVAAIVRALGLCPDGATSAGAELVFEPNNPIAGAIGILIDDLIRAGVLTENDTADKFQLAPGCAPAQLGQMCTSAKPWTEYGGGT